MNIKLLYSTKRIPKWEGSIGLQTYIGFRVHWVRWLPTEASAAQSIFSIIHKAHNKYIVRTHRPEHLSIGLMSVLVAGSYKCYDILV